MDKENKLEIKKIGTLLTSMAIPSIIAMLVTLLYNMVDRIYIGNMNNGTLAMAGLSVTVPIITLIMAFTNLIGSGGAPLAAIKLGEKNKDEAEKIMTNSFSSLIISGLLLSIIVFVFKDKILYMFGADNNTIKPAIDYLSIYIIGTVFVQISQGMNAYINAQGYTKIGMLSVSIGAITNIILDPIFIFTLNMGIKGAALATILSQLLSAIWVIYFFIKKSPMKIRKKYIIPDKKILLKIMMLGISPFIMNSTESILQISFNNQLALYGGNIAVATMSILMSLYQIISLPLAGIAQGAQPILSYNYGAKNNNRVKECFKSAFKVCIAYSVILTVLMLIFAPKFARIFSNDTTTIRYASWAIRIYLAGGFLFGAQVICQQSFMALGQAKRSLLMALFRKVILLIPLIYIMPLIIGNTSIAAYIALEVSDIVVHGGKTFSILLAEPISDILAATMTTILFFDFYKKNL